MIHGTDTLPITQASNNTRVQKQRLPVSSS
jgi:hypothetical protein